MCVWCVSARARTYAFPYYRMRRADNFQICNFAFIPFWCRRQHRYTCLFGCVFFILSNCYCGCCYFWLFILKFCLLPCFCLNLHTICCCCVCAKLFATSVLYADLFIMALFFHGFCFSFLTLPRSFFFPLIFMFVVVFVNISLPLVVR